MFRVRSGKIYYGWVVVATGFTLYSVVCAIQYSFGIFFTPLQEAFGWSRATISWAMTANLVVFALAMAPVGWAIDRFNARAIYFAAAFLVGVPLVLCSRVSQPWQLYLLYGLPVGLGIAICGPVLMSITTRWFIRQRGLALGIVSAGVGFGALVAPISNPLITAYGWRNSFVILGIASFVILSVCAYYIRPAPPASSGESAAGPTLALKGMKFRQAVMTREMFLLVIAQISALFTLRLIMVHVVPYAIDIGMSPPVAALALGTIGGVSITGRVVMGFVQDRIGAQKSMIICMVAQAVSLLALPFIRSDLLFFAYAIVFGFSYGGDAPQVPAVVAQCFGLAAISVIYPLVQAIGNLTGASGPIIAGYIFDVTGSYATVFLGTAFGLAIGTFCVMRLRFPNQHQLGAARNSEQDSAV